MTSIEILGYAGVVLNIGVYLMRTMIPLRILAIASNLVFLTYGYNQWIQPMLVLHSILLPLNCYRLTEMIMLVRKARKAVTAPGFDMSFIRPYAGKQNVTAGETLFSKGEIANAMYLLERGRFILPESGIELGSGTMVGELGLLAPGGLRTQSLVAQEDGVVLRLDYDKFRQLFFQNPQFGFHFLQLTTGRLFENIAALERVLESRGATNPLDVQKASAEA